MGLGDSLYLQSVVRQFLKNGETVMPCSDWPAVFSQLPVTVTRFHRPGVEIVAHYSTRKDQPTDQFEDCCINAGLKLPVEMKLDWKPANRALVERINADGRPIICVQLPRPPMGRKDGYGKELLPDCSTIQKVIDRIGKRAFFVQIGSGRSLYRFRGLGLDLADQTSVTDLLDVASIAGGFLGYVSFMVPLAESFDRPALFVWSRKGLSAPQEYVRRITPQKILHKDSSKWIMDDCTGAEIESAADSLFEQARGCGAVQG